VNLKTVSLFSFTKRYEAYCKPFSKTGPVYQIKEFFKPQL